jgi:uncharacterized protein
MARRVVITLVAWICLTSAGWAQSLTFPALSGRVVDEAGVLSAADNAAITRSLAALEARTTDQLVVVTLKSLQGTTIEDYGYQLGRRWKIGQKDKDSGALLIVIPSEQSVRIEVGYGLEGVITDAISARVIRNVLAPAFRKDDYGGGVERALDALMAVASGGQLDVPDSAAKSPARLAVWRRFAHLPPFISKAERSETASSPSLNARSPVSAQWESSAGEIW